MEIRPSSSEQNIGVVFANMAMAGQITVICKTTHYHPFNNGRIRKCITREACKELIYAVVTFRLDNGNATLFGLPDNQLNRLQRMLNIVVRIITLTSPTNHIAPVPKDLHWLPVKSELSTRLCSSPSVYSSPNQHPPSPQLKFSTAQPHTYLLRPCYGTHFRTTCKVCQL